MTSSPDGPGDPRAADAFETGTRLAAAGRNEDAIAAFLEVTRLQPGHAETFYRIGLSLRALGQNPTAVTALDHAVRLSPRHSAAHRLLGEIHADAGRPAEALAAYRQAIIADPSARGAYVNAAQLLFQLGRDDSALALFDEAIAIPATDVYGDRTELLRAYLNKGLSLVQIGRFAEGLEALDTGLDGGWDHPLYYQHRALALSRLGRHQEALHSLTISQRLEPVARAVQQPTDNRPVGENPEKAILVVRKTERPDA
ncbi:hypothetical protein AMIS_27660 [Actinoplanes missouriensis 431]|uniref:Uncharacterized protein n=1 Tax=Actinoplanes missouriensis (strain ATCC 14538 / DSM 43046 / CBS 188.64 / JCM 3121 / NBRC 102363 / NCIMB 12654 / NRRL B-3342 / UNCC 431) TaxID=512565 RepID=I0H4P9_ACTM4|nr:tetratricopeptide repeat protein [Actinoplanes missouriensis]BAL87986.1 hypothetical protein AMIS_27660 [Actinoplanes missouriensis 431]